MKTINTDNERTLLIMRHAKSSWKNHNLSDRDRPLNKRGLRDAPMMGERLNALGYSCDRLISSPALRAKSTAKTVSSAFSYDGEIIEDERLYMADVKDYLDVIAGVDMEVKDLMIVSHNPGSEELLSYLTGVESDLPTSAYALIAVMGSWRDMDLARLLHYDFPKSKEAR